jgi:hypothetical protein
MGHPQAKRAYAWSYETGGKRRFLAVLGLGPVVDARTAVQASIVVAERKKRPVDTEDGWMHIPWAAGYIGQQSGATL